MPRITQEILEERQDGFAQQQIDFCRAKMEVLARDPDRAKALSTMLFPNGFSGPMPSEHVVATTLEDVRANELRWWAIAQLGDMHTADADKVLTLYFAAVERLDRNHPLRYEAFWQLEDTKEWWRAYGRKN